MNKHNKFSNIQIECYERNMNCSGCMYTQYNQGSKGNRKPTCRVKKSIIEYIVQYGLPTNLKTKGIIDV